MDDLVYLDNAATSFPKPDVMHDAVRDFYRSNGVNPDRDRAMPERPWDWDMRDGC